jgi:hypothetical protein
MKMLSIAVADALDLRVGNNTVIYHASRKKDI